MDIIAKKLVTLEIANQKVSNVINHVHVHVQIALTSVVKSAIRTVRVSPSNNAVLLLHFLVHANVENKRQGYKMSQSKQITVQNNFSFSN